MNPRRRVGLVVAALAAGAAVATVGATVVSSSGDEGASATTVLTPRQGSPPLLLDLGVRTDPEAQALRRAETLLRRGRRAEAGRVFANFDSVDAEVGAAVAGWPDGTIDRLETLAQAHPKSALVLLHLGLARFWARRDRDAVEAWREAERGQPDSMSAVRAGDLLHPDAATGLPVFVASFGPPRSVSRLAPPAQLAALRSAARSGGAREKLLYGVALQRLGRPISAQREYDAAAAAEPRNAEAQVAAAVARFRKDDPSRAFSRLGPLTRRYPREPSVRFHLGLLLLWIGRVDEAKLQLARAHAAGPNTVIGGEANRFLARLESIGR